VCGFEGECLKWSKENRMLQVTDSSTAGAACIPSRPNKTHHVWLLLLTHIMPGDVFYMLLLQALDPRPFPTKLLLTSDRQNLCVCC
jgi:hypothetical protein